MIHKDAILQFTGCRSGYFFFKAIVKRGTVGGFFPLQFFLGRVLPNGIKDFYK